jgi:hypothetical protein
VRGILVGLLIAVMTVTASAQQSRKPPANNGGKKTEEHATPVDENEYKNSLKTLRDKSYDPWKTVR